MQAQRIGIYNQFSTNRNQQKQTKNPIGFGMMLDISGQEEFIRKLVGSEVDFEKVTVFFKHWNKRKNMVLVFKECYKELHPNGKVFKRKRCRDFGIASPKLRLFKTLDERLSISVVEEAGDRVYIGAEDVNVDNKLSTKAPISADDLIEKIKIVFKKFAKERISFDEFYEKSEAKK